MQPTCAGTVLAPGAAIKGVLLGRKTGQVTATPGNGLNTSGCVLFSPCCWLMFVLSKNQTRAEIPHCFGMGAVCIWSK